MPPLEIKDIHNDELSQWVNMKSLLMSSVTSTSHLNFSQIARDGVSMPTLTGLYTDEQLDALQQQTSRGDAVDQIVNHLAARIVETKN